MLEPITTITVFGTPLGQIVGWILNLYYGGNLLKTFGHQMPQRYINSRLTDAEKYALQKIRGSLSKIADALEGEKPDKVQEHLTALTDALILRARAQFHVGTGRWRPESAQMLLEFCEEKPDLPLSYPNEAGRNDNLTPQPQVAAMLRSTLAPPITAEAAAQSTKDAEALLSNARHYCIFFDEMRELLEELFSLRHEGVCRKSAKDPLQSPERRDIRARRADVKSRLKAYQKRIGDLDQCMNPPKVLNQIAGHIRDAYDLQIQRHAKDLSAFGIEPALILPDSLATAEPLSPLAADDNLSELFRQFYAVVHKRWDKAVLSRYDKSMLLSGKKLVPLRSPRNSGYARIPRWTKMRKTGRSTGDGITKIGLPTEIVKQAIDGWLGEYRRTQVIKLIKELEMTVNTLQGNVVYLEKELMLQLDDITQAVEAELKELSESKPPEDQIQAHQAHQDLLAQMLTVFKQVKGQAQIRKFLKEFNKPEKENAKDDDEPTRDGAHTRRNLPNGKRRRKRKR